MNTRRRTLSSVVIAGLALAITMVHAKGGHVQIDGYVVQHTAFTTDTLQPEVANAYDIPRSTNRGMVNVVVLKKLAGSATKPVAAKINASAANLTGQARQINMREIREKEAVYYIADFRVADEETLDFALEITPADEKAPYTVKFRHQFFTH